MREFYLYRVSHPGSCCSLLYARDERDVLRKADVEVRRLRDEMGWTGDLVLSEPGERREVKRYKERVAKEMFG